MSTIEIKAKLEQAHRFLDSAKIEMNRPAEDVVSYMVCRSVRNSVANYLMSYLLKKEVMFNDEESVEELLIKCKQINDDFNEIDLSAITFTKDYEYSAEIDQMDKCIDLAINTKNLVTNKLLR